MRSSARRRSKLPLATRRSRADCPWATFPQGQQRCCPDVQSTASLAFRRSCEACERLPYVLIRSCGTMSTTRVVPASILCTRRSPSFPRASSEYFSGSMGFIRMPGVTSPLMSATATAAHCSHASCSLKVFPRCFRLDSGRYPKTFTHTVPILVRGHGAGTARGRCPTSGPPVTVELPQLDLRDA
jgi:hypothetical protein